MLWTEKYRPKSVDTFEGPEHLKSILRNSSERGHPNLLLYGPPGTGKTTFAHLLATRKLELNASDERGISVIREKIKVYASTLEKDKTVILDECENLTSDAQHCLRRVIEDSVNTRFIFITNYPSKIIGPLRSRLVGVKFTLADNRVLEGIGGNEGLGYDKELYRRLFKLCGNDLRKAINVLQGIAPLSSFCIEEAVGSIPQKTVDEFWKVGRAEVMDYSKMFLRDGYSALQLVRQLAGCWKGSDAQSAKFHLLLSSLEEKAVLGCSDELVLYNLLGGKVEIFSQ
ncbi:DNA replication factor C small subunit [Encephalitozoon intestinalis ATCC 50506]|uniref:DNA replication factor C small subunit n=1 Tax=Encephalitozoon intestinalis (strain ATCC 50506) TaxID=876142 RepID=E0S5S7_ENCIT|nr:DNA replication factor C small subunit [Encephalitozoon intestinalis ATCC 50506]ADM11062.1 DNA replication factor C small subunit [Encephalitozoon intestinalis ATCC 50506]UTX44712.1 replication factor C [Encephalitozoon intestinalis]